MPLRLYIIRHADPDYANDTITAAGHLEAKALAAAVARLLPNHLYTSPKGRAVATAKCCADALGIKAEILPWTREMSDCRYDHPTLGDMAVWDCPGEDVRSDPASSSGSSWHELAHLRDPIVRESIQRLIAESDRFLESHGFRREGARYRILAPDRKQKIAVVCHMGFGLAWLSHLLGLPLPLVWAGFWLPPASITTILFERRSPDFAVPRCLGLGDIAHCQGASLPPNSSGLHGLS
jgi:probable phosphoglycerate mutase